MHGAITAYQAGASGSGITVGIIDSGIDADNTEFTGRISASSQAFGGNTSIQDIDGHGTAVATILAGGRNNNLIMGMAWNSTILALRADTPGSCTTTSGATDEPGCSFNTANIAQALDHARTTGAKVVNISLGGDNASTSLLSAVDRATTAGMILVLSAGNDGTAAPDGFAQQIVARGHGLVIIAASVDADGSHSDFSNGATGFETSTLSALGDRVLSQDETGGQFLWSGTSFSAPQISGAVALLLQAFPNLTPAQVVALLKSSATDAGASGADAVFGSGILNLTRAFQPAGTVSLAGTSTTVSLTDNGSLSAPMGDASSVGSLSAVGLDSLGRAYTLDIKPTFGSHTPSLMLAPALQGTQRNVRAGAGPAVIAMSIGQGRDGRVDAWRLMLNQRDATQARAISGSIVTRLGLDTSIALGFSQGATSLTANLDGMEHPAFLVATDSGSANGFDRVAGQSMALRQRIAPGLSLTLAAEQGRTWRTDGNGRPLRSWDDENRRDGYASVSLGLEKRTGAFTLTGRVTHLREDATLLGARFAGAIGTQAGRSLFMDSGVALDAGKGWQFDATVRQGWTWSNAGATGSARIRTNAWSLGAQKAGVADRHDQVALRLSQPLRVESGGLSLLLPSAYDYATRQTTWATQTLGLAPKGREVDAEAVYGRPVGAGWMTVNSYWRQQPGNLAWYPDDIGGAVRYSLSF